MAAPPYMKLYVADYLADTTHLKRGEHGAYLLLLMAMWRAGGKLPANDGKLAQIAKCSPREWAEVRETVLAFFTRRGGQLTHKRLAAEMAKAETVSSVRKGASEKGVAERAKKNKAKAEPNGSPNADQLVPYIKHQSQKEETPNPLEGGRAVLTEFFAKAWKAYPEAGRGNHGPEAAWPEWEKASARAGGEARLLVAVERRAAWLAEHPRERVKAFHRWLRDDGFVSYLSGEAPVVQRRWVGPPDVWDLVATSETPSFANTWLADCRWSDIPRAIIGGTTSIRRLREKVGPALADNGIELQEQAA